MTIQFHTSYICLLLLTGDLQVFLDLLTESWNEIESASL